MNHVLAIIQNGSATAKRYQDNAKKLKKYIDVSIGFVTPVDEVDSTVKIYTFFGSFTRKLEDYLKTWRCWKHEPTAEEMKTTPWMTSKPSK